MFFLVTFSYFLVRISYSAPVLNIGLGLTFWEWRMRGTSRSSRVSVLIWLSVSGSTTVSVLQATLRGQSQVWRS